VGPGVEVLATAPGGQPVAVRQGTVLVTSFHPEITADDRIHRLFVAMARGA
jgi:5'-phosphate synthase pdxT subunit